MPNSSAPRWDALEKQHPNELVDFLKTRFAAGGKYETTPSQLSSESNCKSRQAAALLDDLVAGEHMETSTVFHCPCDNEYSLSNEEADQVSCPSCKEAFADKGDGVPLKVTYYVMDAPQRRIVKWVLALHGMNTRGAWQEELSWQMSKSYRYSVPFAIYKYGMVRPGVLFKWRMRQLRRQVDSRILRLTGETSESGFGGKPDVIAHSFGTWLLGQALLQNDKLKVGRVILTGCILRPDFDWQWLIKVGQVEAVLCHYGTKDFWARIAHYVIPDTGPSGRRGFNDPKHAIVHHRAEGFKHSDFFLEQNLQTEFTAIWKNFLSAPTENLQHLNSDIRKPKDWNQTIWPFRATILRYFILIAALAAIGFFAFVFWRGLLTVWS